MNLAKPLIIWQNNLYLDRLAVWKGLDTYKVGQLIGIKQYRDYGQLLRINSMFSSHPFGDPVDRTGWIKTPLKRHISRPWTRPQCARHLDEALALRVQELEVRDQPINLMWSGGIDSTCMVNAFLANSRDRAQLRVLYSPYSYYEHPQYLEFLKSNRIETQDISGDVYRKIHFDGIFVTGDGGDELNASMDESFLEKYGHSVLSQSWKDFFWSRTQDSDFLDFCEIYFSRSQLDIQTVLQARWWFYANSKLWSLKNDKYGLWINYHNLSHDLVLSFFDSVYYESYIINHLDLIMPSADHIGWKSELKKYSTKVDGMHSINQNMGKVHSKQLNFYAKKQIIMSNRRTIWLLSDGSRVATPSLPLISHKEWQETYGESLDYLWNEPDSI